MVCLSALTVSVSTPTVHAQATSGQLDLTFNPGPLTIGGDIENSMFLFAVAVQPDGKILVGGNFDEVNFQSRQLIARFNPDGTLDTSFNTPITVIQPFNGEVYDIVLQPDGKILVAGFFNVGGEEKYIVRLESDGTLDTTFDADVDALIYRVVLQPDGKIIIGSNSLGTVDGVPVNYLARLNPDGSLDTALGAISFANGSVFAIALQPDGKIVVAGSFYIVRLNADGTYDPTFNPPDVGTSTIYAMALQADGRILYGGRNATGPFLARVNADGSADGTFSAPSILFGGTLWTIVVQPDGKILIGGNFIRVNGVERGSIARLNPDGTLDTFHPDPSGADDNVEDIAVEADGNVLIVGSFKHFYDDFGGSVRRNGFARLLNTISNRLPIANATAPATATVGTNCMADVILDGSASSDPDGDTLTYSWTDNNIEIATGANPTVSLAVGTHNITLTVTDPSGASDSTTVTVVVTSNVTLAFVGPALLQQFGPNIVQASVTDPQGPIAGASITITVNGAVFAAVSDASGIASVDVGPVTGGSATIQIDYADAPCGAATTTVTRLVNRWPVASASASSPNVVGPGCTPAEVTLNGGATTDADGDPLSFAWDEGGVPLATGVNPTVPLGGGNHQITLTVTDGRGGTGSTTISVFVQAQPSLITYNGPTTFTTGVPTPVSATLTTNDGTPIQGATVRFAIALDGVDVAATTDASGVATTTLTLPASGSRTLMVNYFGSPCHESKGVNVDVTVVPPTATLTVITTVVNDNGGALTPADFSVTVSGSSPNPSSFPGSGQGVQVTLAAGSYLVVQAPRPEYKTTMSADCSGSILAGESKTCTITNDDQPATLTLTKLVVNDNGGTATAGAWQLSAGGTPFVSGVSQPINAGTYALTESTGPTGYAPSAWSCTGAGTLTGNQLTLGLGQIASCSITNDDRSGQLTVFVQVLNNNGGAAQPGDVTVNISGVTASPSSFGGSATGTVVQLHAGDYAVGSTSLANYSKSTSADCTGSMTLAGAKTCTITFDDNAPVNNPPVANPQSVTTSENTPVAITLVASDPDGDSLTYNVSQPSHGTLSGTAPNLTYTPTLGYVGPDSFTFFVSDGQLPSAPAAISIMVKDVNSPPVANGQTLQTAAGTPLAVTLTGSDPDGDPLTFAIVAGPANGSLGGTVPNLIYTPKPGYTGPDSFTFRVNDGTVDSNVATINITVTPLSADLAVSIQAGPSVAVGQSYTYTVVVRNNGPDPVPSPQVTFNVPAGMSYTTAPPCTGTTQLTCMPGPLDPGQERPFPVIVQPTSIGQQIASASVPTSGDPNPTNNEAMISTQVLQSPTTTTLTAPPSSAFGESVTLSASVTGYAPTGTVTFSSDAGPIDTVALVNGAASTTTTSLPTGSRMLTARYDGDTNNASSSDSAAHQVQRVISATTVSSSLNPSTVGQPVTFTATVIGRGPTGTVTFTIGAATQTVALGSNGTATFQTSALSAGTHTVIASYVGDANHTPSTSAAITQQVGPTASSIVLSVEPNPAAPGTSVLLRATVSGFSPTGTVTFLENNAVLGTGAITDGVATLVISQGKKGSRQLNASYPGDANNLASTSNKVRLTTK